MSFFAIRPDIGVSTVAVLLKAGFAAAAASAVLPALLALSKPGRPLSGRLKAIGGFFGLAALIAIIALIGAEPGERMSAWTGGGFPWCVVMIPLLATPTAALLAFVLRDLAPTRLRLTGAVLGAVSGGIGAMVYAMYCPMDSVAFVATWYAVGIGLSAAIGALVGSWLLRW